MAIHHRKVLISSQINYQVLPYCGDNKYCHYSYPDHLPPPPPPPPPPQNFNGDESKPTLLTPIVVTLLFCFAIIFVTGCYTIRKYCFKNSRGRNSLNFDRNEDFVNENHSREMAHPIWLINTVGLQQSVIDSIAVFKYKKDEGLIDGADCSVCLSEFQEDESLRLLPKCSHAFHIPCIDTWLRSHKNCPLCRAPVALDTNNGALNTAERNLNGLSSREENLVDNFAYNGGLGTQENRDETSEMGRGAGNIGPLALPIQQGNTREILDKNSHYFNVRNCDVRVRSDLADHSAIRVEELQEVRRSISMDSSSASVIHFAVSNIRPMEHKACSKKLVSQKVGKQDNKSSSRIYGVMKSSSFGRHSHKGPGSSMKRSFSSSGKCYKPRSSTSQDSILPL